MQNLKNVSNPWEDERNFIQDVGDVKGFLKYIDKNNILSSKKDDCFIQENNLNLLQDLNEASKEHFEKIKLLEVLYDKYRNESILSKDKNDQLCDRIDYLSEILDKVEKNKIKIANLLHNTQMSENNVIKISHSKKFDFIKILKTIIIQLKNSSTEFELINLSSNVHPETLNKIVK
jgi:hypothetical protein